MKNLLQIESTDNVLVALQDLQPGATHYRNISINLPQFVPRKHKFVRNRLNKGDKVTMYGVPVGTALEDLPAGTLITTKNVAHFAESIVFSDCQYDWEQPDIESWKNQHFMGYHRTNGTVGTSNYWLFIPLVFCENRNLKVIEEALLKSLGYYTPNQYENYIAEKLNLKRQDGYFTQERIFPNIDGIKFLYHQGGCGGSRKDSEILLRLLAGYLHHPNVAGATVLSLGCQHAQIKWFQEIQQTLYPNNDKPIIYLEQQQIRSEEKLIKAAIDQTLQALPDANKITRQPASLSKLVVGLECGASDGFSGISANPAVGHTSDLIVALGGTSILSEFPELNGVEQNLIDRCINHETAQKFIQLQRAYETLAKSVGSGFDMNPSPGNIKDGLITDAIKSAGAAKKGGKAPVQGSSRLYGTRY